MSIGKAIKVLCHYNAYRRDNSVPAKVKMPDAKELGEAIDFAIGFLRGAYFFERHGKK